MVKNILGGFVKKLVWLERKLPLQPHSRMMQLRSWGGTGKEATHHETNRGNEPGSWGEAWGEAWGGGQFIGTVEDL